MKKLYAKLRTNFYHSLFLLKNNDKLNASTSIVIILTLNNAFFAQNKP